MFEDKSSLPRAPSGEYQGSLGCREGSVKCGLSPLLLGAGTPSDDLRNCLALNPETPHPYSPPMYI
jgi:hypothetical protein